MVRDRQIQSERSEIERSNRGEEVGYDLRVDLKGLMDHVREPLGRKLEDVLKVHTKGILKVLH